MPLYTVSTQGSLQPYLGFEWLLTNGLGGFAASSVVGCNTRRYHGLLCAALNPPVNRVMTLNRLGEILYLDGKTDHLLEFSVNQFRGTFHPHGEQYLRTFELDRLARWEYIVEGVAVTKEVQLVWKRNIVGVRYTIHSPSPRAVELQLLPFVSLRDFHALRSANNARFMVSGMNRQISVADGPLTLYVDADAGHFVERGDWWYGQTYAIETERGQDDSEDLFSPGSFHLRTEDGRGSITLWAGTEPPGVRDWDEELARRPRAAVGRAGGHAAVSAVVSARNVDGESSTQGPDRAPKNPGLASTSDPASAGHEPGASAEPSLTLRRLAHAAADFIVMRKQHDGSAGTTVIAGYPWFADWGRDTMIALPGLFLTTGRFAEAAQVLSVFAQFTSEGMIPNRFDDYTDEPHYNTVDASLWFIHASHEYLRASGDRGTFDTRLRPACEQIIAGYQRGTRFHIAMDPADGLITAGDASTQLTWMDAKQGNIAFTPRQGKAVEINALWYHALKLMGRQELAGKVAASFVTRFWISPFRGCCDVGSENSRDMSLRPNQIFAASLPNSPLSSEQRAAVVEVVRRELLTPYGLRTLARNDPNYAGRYTGDVMRRDRAYHNGTVWPWLIGPFLEAYLRCNDRSADARRQARVWLQPLIDHMQGGQGCVGQISEVFDGDEPHRPGGCFAQAWSVGEVLRLAVELEM